MKSIPHNADIPSSSVPLVDSHCHLDMESYRTDLDMVMARAAATGIAAVVTIGIDLPSSHAAIKLAHRFPRVWATVGIHPHNASEADDNALEELAQLARNNRGKVCAIGEIGLDYAKLYSPLAAQQSAFHAQLELAEELNLPVVIHDREAHTDCLDILRSHAPLPAGGVMHCFSGTVDLARAVLDLGLDISIPGIITFKTAHDLREVAAAIPLERMLLESDGPFLAPVPFRGKRNEPALVNITAQAVAQQRNEPLAQVAAETTETAKRLFGLHSLL